MAATEWPERTRLLVTIGVVVAVNLGVWAVTYMARTNCEKLRGELEKVKAEVKKLKGLPDELAMRNRELEQLQIANKKWQKKLPEESRRDELSTRIADLAQRLQMVEKTRRNEIDRKVDLPGLNNPNVVCDILRTQWEADYGSLGEFINSVEEHYDPLISIENLIITDKDNGMGVTGEAKHDVGLDIVSYRYQRPVTP